MAVLFQCMTKFTTNKKKKESKVKVYLNKNRLSEGDWADLLGAAALGLFSKMVFLVVSRSVVSDSL